MYINEIYSLLDETLNRIYDYWIENGIKNKETIGFEKIINEKNFKKYQKEINKLFEFLFIFIPQDKINKIVVKNNNIDFINNILKKYISYYIFLFIGITYKGKIEDYNNNIIEYTKEQYNYSVKIDDFYTTDSNSNIIKNLKLMTELFNYFKNKNKEKSDTLKSFIDSLDVETIMADIKTKKNDNEKFHDIIKIIIFLVLFESEKKHVFDIIEMGEISTGEFIFIDIVYNKIDYIELLSIENVLEPIEIDRGYSEIIYEMINEDEILEIDKIRNYNINYDYKIKKLFDYKILVPIVDDFLLFHKDYEKYEKTKDEKTHNKRDDTKLKYITNKLNNVKDYYKNKNEISKIFHKPMIDKKVVLINNNEELKILYSSENILKSNSQNISLIVDFREYREYPFVPFKDYDKTYFLYSNDKTIDVIRNINFVNETEHNFKNLQIRIASENMFVNVVGFAIINNSVNISCYKASDFKLIENKNINKNIDLLINDKLDMSIFNGLKVKKGLYYLLFDLEKQHFNIPFNNLKSNNDKIKIILSYFYDNIVNNIIIKIQKYISKTKEKNIIINLNILNNFIRKFPDILNKDYYEIYNELLYYIYYEKSEIITDFYDSNEDIFKGLYENIFTIPTYNNISKSIISKLIINTGLIKNKFIKNIKSEIISATCQHYVSWNKLDKKNPDKIYEFVQQYALVNKKDQYVCKSCEALIDISRYILNSTFNKKTNRFEDFDVSVAGSLEDMIEYSKYSNGIKYIDVRIDRIANILNIFLLRGNDFSPKARRRIMVKIILDLLINQKKVLDKNNYILSRDKIINSYGIPKEYNIFFIFNLDNSIFSRSSKDKVDYNKIQKLNNIICFILILLIIDITEQQILTITDNDIVCNLKNFKNFKNLLFDKKMIIINSSLDLKPIIEYPILCYLIYMFSCFVIKYNVWEEKLTDKNDFGKFQKIIVNTFIEILNSILSVDKEEMKKNNINLYEILFARYYLKLPLYRDKDNKLFKILEDRYLYKKEDEKKLLYETDKFDLNKNIFDTSPNIVDDLYNIYSKNSMVEILNINKKRVVYEKTYNATNLTNCKNGSFHNFVNNGNKLICNYCKMASDVYINGIDKDDKILEKYDILYLKKLSKKYCIDGKFHKFKESICKNCNYKKNDDVEYGEKELKNMYEKIQEKVNTNNISIDNILKRNIIKNEEDNKHIKKILEKIFYKFEKYEKNVENTINILMDKVQEILGIDIYINEELYNLNKDVYVLEYDIDGTRLLTPEKIIDENNQIKYVNNHPIFKKDVILIFLERNVKFEVAFDSRSKIMLGHRKTGKEFILTNNLCNIKINYSIKNLFLYFGIIRYNIYLNDLYVNDKISMNLFLNKCSKYRFNVIKSLGYNINKYINRLKNRYEVSLISSKFVSFNENNNKTVYEIYNNDTKDIIYDNVFKKFNKDIDLDKSNNDTKHVFMKYFNTINEYLDYEHTDIELKENEFILSDDIIKNDKSSNIVFNYIIDEIIRLLDYNSNKLVKNTLITFILSLVINIFNDYSNDILLSNKDIDNFKQFITRSDLLTENKYIVNENNEEFFKDIDFEDMMENEMLEKKNEQDSEKDDDNERLEAVSGNDGNVENEYGETEEFEDFSEIEQNID
jgi:hypothetical protein